jgi:hypothetical protein
MTRAQDVTCASVGRQETLPTGESITKAIVMGGNACCGSAFSEQSRVA